MFSPNLAALEVNDLYQASVIVDSQASKEREHAIKDALQTVFLKIGGKKSVLTHDVLQQAQRRASRYVSQYRYHLKNDQLSIIVRFNENKVNQLFQQANLSIWGTLRPQILLWLVDEQGATRSIIATDAETTIPEVVNDFSVQRGLPIIMPLMDLTDIEQVVVNDFWYYFPEQIQQASLRYLADTVVVMRVSDSSLLPNSADASPENADLKYTISCGLLCETQEIPKPKILDWRVYTQGALYTKSYQGLDKDSLINQGLSDITELIYQSYALLTSAEHDFIIKVKNVTSLKSDTQLFDFLTGLSAVKTVTLTAAQGDSRQFKLDLIGTRTSFLASLKLNDKLTQYVEPQLYQPDEIKPLSEQEVVAQGFDEEKSYQGKVIIFGEEQEFNQDNDNIKESDLDAEDASKAHLLDENTVNTVPDKDNVNLLNAKPTDEPEQKAPAELASKVKAKQLIVPSIPVFYWEQG